MENITLSPVTPLYQVALTPYVAIVCVAMNIFILLSNSLVIVTFRKYKKLKVQHYYMLALVGTDLTVFIQNSALATILIKQDITLTTPVCVLLGCLASFATTMTAMVHTCLSIDRWISVVHPVKYRNFVNSRNSRRFTVAVLVAIHIGQGLQQFVCWHFQQISYYFDPYVPYCVAEFGDKGGAGLIMALLMAIVLPCLIELTLNAHIILKIKRMRSTTRARTLKAVKTVLLTLGVYYLCWIPMGVWTVWDFISPHVDPAGWFNFLAVQVVVLNSGISGVIYYYTLPNFKETLMSTIHNSFSLSRTSQST